MTDPSGAPREPAGSAQPTPTPAPSSVRRYARTDGAAVTFDVALCQHAGECVRGLPDVFDTAKRPWIQPEHATLDEIEAVIDRCPSLALKFERPAAN
ncbi:MAG: (4Fe-4S)-binding protein [Patulibacter sp.]|nr:(4Fe-4S)-binding protein [Patulibacter sp.]